MRFVYFAPGDIQVARVDRQCIVNFCEALHQLGVEIELVVMGIKTMSCEPQATDPLDLYRLESKFPVRTVPTSLDQGCGNFRWSLERLWVHVREGLRHLTATRQDEPLVLYTKNQASALALLVLRGLTGSQAKVIFEAHVPPKTPLGRFVLSRVDGIVANSLALGSELTAGVGLAPAKVLGVHQGINLELYQRIRCSKLEARRHCGLSPDKKYAVYTGKIYWGYQEVEYYLAAARLLDRDVELVLVGGREDHVQRYRDDIVRQGVTNVTFVGFVPPHQVHYYPLAADVLLLYYPSGIDLNRYRSPGKLFEYMASSNPIIAADYPVLREILGHEGAAMFMPPDLPDQLAMAIRELVADQDRAAVLARRALDRVGEFTWQARARKILQFVAALG